MVSKIIKTSFIWKVLLCMRVCVCLLLNIIQRPWGRCRGRPTGVSTNSSVSTRFWRLSVLPTNWLCSTVPATDVTTHWWPPSATFLTPATATSTFISRWIVPVPARRAARWQSTRRSLETRAATRSSSGLSTDVSQVDLVFLLGDLISQSCSRSSTYSEHILAKR